MRQQLIIIFTFFLCCSANAQDYWAIVPASPTSCFSEQDDYEKKLQSARDKNKRELDEKGDAIRKKAEGLSQEEKMKIATKQMNMSSSEIIQMQNEQMEMMTAMQSVQEKGTEVVSRFNELETEYRSEFASRLGAIEGEMRKLPDGEGTPQWAIEKGEQLKTQYDEEYQALCLKYFIGANTPFKLWLADYKKYLIEEDIPYAQKTSAIQYKQYGLTPDNSMAVMDAVGKYLDYCHTIFGLRKPYP